MRPHILVLVLAAACGSKKSNDPPPPTPVNGSPVAFVVDKLTPGDDMKGSLDVRVYNASDKRVGSYGILIRYSDAAGKVVRIKPGTPFEAGFDHWSMSGGKYLCSPKTWCSFELDHLDVPAKAAKAEVLASRLGAFGEDGRAEPQDFFVAKDSNWPGSEHDRPDLPAALARWDMAARKAAWQGAWAGEGFGLGSKAAWLIEGDKITFVDSKGEHKGAFELESPCTVGMPTDNGGFVSTFTLKGNELWTGLGDAGSKNGDKAIVCGGGDIYTLDGTACTVWRNHFSSRWESEPGTCGIKQDGGKDIFFYTRNGDTYVNKLVIDGEVIASEQLINTHAKKFPDLAAAKASQGL